ncbi:MAG: hypothetical protein V2I37_09795, partial [Marinilabiliaceae bacterium]|nr:hypothetical protein [Marinilabiliaceae bacterium]
EGKRGRGEEEKRGRGEEGSERTEEGHDKHFSVRKTKYLGKSDCIAGLLNCQPASCYFIGS